MQVESKAVMNLFIESREMAPTEKLAMLGKRQGLIGMALKNAETKESKGRYWASRDLHESGECVSCVLSLDLSPEELNSLGEWMGSGYVKLYDEHQVGRENVLGIPEVAVQIYVKENA